MQSFFRLPFILILLTPRCQAARSLRGGGGGRHGGEEGGGVGGRWRGRGSGKKERFDERLQKRNESLKERIIQPAPSVGTIENKNVVGGDIGGGFVAVGGLLRLTRLQPMQQQPLLVWPPNFGCHHWR